MCLRSQYREWHIWRIALLCLLEDVRPRHETARNQQMVLNPEWRLNNPILWSLQQIVHGNPPLHHQRATTLHDHQHPTLPILHPPLQDRQTLDIVLHIRISLAVRELWSNPKHINRKYACPDTLCPEDESALLGDNHKHKREQLHALKR